MQLIAVVSLWLLAVGTLSSAAAGEGAGRRAPGFALPDENMKYHDLADYRGKVVILEIMLTRCPACQKLAGTLEEIKRKYGDRIAVLSVVNPPDNRASVQAFKRDHGVTSPILFDCGQMAASYLRPDPKRPRIHVPHLFLIDRTGVIRKHFAPADQAIRDRAVLEAEIEKLLQTDARAN